MRLVMAAFAVSAASAGVSFGQATLDRPVGEPRPYALDSGPVGNPAAFTAAAFSRVVTVQGAAWLRLRFAPRTELKPGSFIRITSAADGEVQKLDAATLARWGGTSAYFNGDSVLVELVAGPETAGNRVAIEQVSIEPAGAARAPMDQLAACGICGPDDRVPSDELWTARLLPAGCTASVFAGTSCLASAGHCVVEGMVLEFDVPDSDPNCTLNHPPVADQFPVLEADYLDAGVGDDWSVLVPGPNGLGQLPYERYGQLRPIATDIPEAARPVAVWGYGMSGACVRSQTQQTSGGSVTGVFARHCDFDVDVRGGSSGSALIDEGRIAAVVTHCDPDCPNSGTRVDHDGFAEARDVLADPGLLFWFPGGLPQVLDPQGGTSVRVVAGPDGGAPVPASGMLHLSVDGGPYVATPLATDSANGCTAVFPALGCGAVATYYFSVEAEGGDTVNSPRWAPYDVYTAISADEIVELFEDDFQTDRGWTVEAWGNLTGGQWQRAVPLPATVCDRGNPGADADGSGRCYLTEKNPGDCDSDVDGGSAVLVSPAIDLAPGEAVLSYYRWFSTVAAGNPLQDVLTVELSADGGGTWRELETVGPRGRAVRGGWFARSFHLTGLDGATGRIVVRFVASDSEPPSVVEAAVDGFRVIAARCADACPWDLDGGGVGVSDFLTLLAQWGTDPGGPPDFDADGDVGVADFLILLAHWGPCDFP